MRVLVVEDDCAVLQMTRALLADDGHHADGVSTASGALRQLATRGYDVILCDLHLPDLAAEDFLSTLSPLDAARVVFVTGGACNRRDSDLLARRRVLYKPFTFEQPREAIALEAA